MNRREIDRVAQYLVDQIGPKAAPHAQENVDWSNARDDASGASDWMQIRRTIETLLLEQNAEEGLKPLVPPAANLVPPIVSVGVKERS